MLLAMLLFAALDGRILHPADADDVRALALITPEIALERTGSAAPVPPDLQAAYRAQTAVTRAPASPHSRASNLPPPLRRLQDVLDVTEVVSKMVPIDPKRVFLTGHSMGAMGTCAIGFKYPDRFAALAPVAGVSNVSSALLASAPQMTVLLAQGCKDALVVPRAAIRASDMSKASLKSFTYQEWPDAGHFTIGTVSVPAILDFFDRAGATNR